MSFSSLEAERRHHEHLDPHRRQTWIADVLLGGQDGLVNVLGIVLGVSVASGEARIVLAAGLSAALAESVSMAAVAYTASRTAGDLYRGEREREYRHVRTVPNVEREEVREIYARLGFEGELLDRIVETITRDEDVWVAVMMAHEHRLEDIEPRRSLRSAGLVGLASMVGSLVPLAPFLFLPVGPAAWASVGAAALSLFAFGAFKSAQTWGRPIRGAVELTVIGIASALIGYVVGLLFRAAP
jgi:vacuolar iron transporter family protein